MEGTADNIKKCSLERGRYSHQSHVDLCIWAFCHNLEDAGDENDRIGQRKIYIFWKNQKGKPRKTNSSLGKVESHVQGKNDT